MEADDRTRTDNLLITNQLLCQLSHIGMMNSKSRLLSSDSDGNRTRVTAVKGRCLNRLTTGPLFSSSVAEPFLILSYNFYNCKSFFLILSIFLLKFFTVFYDFLKLIFYSFFENISYVPYSIVLSLIYTAKLPAG